jgi:AcrR family transcriptional regulator
MALDAEIEYASGVPDLRERKKSRARREMTAAALRLFAERGYGPTTVADIAAAAEVSQRTFFRYFSSKVDAVFGDAPERLAALRESLALRGARSVHEAVREVFLGMAAEFEREKAVYLVRAKLMTSEPAVRGRFFELLATIEEEIAVAAAPGRPSPDDVLRARLLAAVLTAALRASAFAWAASGGRASLTGYVSNALDAMAPVAAALEAGP